MVKYTTPKHSHANNRHRKRNRVNNTEIVAQHRQLVWVGVDWMLFFSSFRYVLCVFSNEKKRDSIIVSTVKYIQLIDLNDFFVEITKNGKRKLEKSRKLSFVDAFLFLFHCLLFDRLFQIQISKRNSQFS